MCGDRKDRKTGKEEVIDCDIVLSAVGVTLKKIGLETLGIKTDRGVIQVDPFTKTNVAGIYAIEMLSQARHWHMWQALKAYCVSKNCRNACWTH